MERGSFQGSQQTGGQEMKLFLIFDDREIAQGEIRTLIGARRYGDVIFKRVALVEHFRTALPEWARSNLFHVRTHDDLAALRSALELGREDATVCVISARAGFADPGLLFQLIERLPFANEDFTDRLYKPLIVFLNNAHWLVEHWDRFAQEPLSQWTQVWQAAQRLQSVEPLDLSKIRDFLLFTSGSTVARHFNQVEIDEYYYTKSSSDRRKMKAEYSFHGLVPEAMRPWLIQPFDYKEEGGRASYRMLRYYLADAALQWVHGALDVEAFGAFIDRLLFFVSIRTRKACDRQESLRVAQELFVDKVRERAQRFLSLPEGQRIDALAASSNPQLAMGPQLDRYLRLYRRFEKSFQSDFLAVGHGDPCFSNVLYDQQRYLMKLIDPKGALAEEDLWTHPLYDLCKISHSALGDYDFINNGLYSIGFARDNEFVLKTEASKHMASLKSLFRQRIEASGFSQRAMRLGEASLFLSMLPLHLDYPNKVLAFMLKANEILDEVENG
jgi:hypothetical protein